VERIVRNVWGVLGVTNIIEVNPRVADEEVQAKIAETLGGASRKLGARSQHTCREVIHCFPGTR
jgi:hypothetical protein